MPWLVENERNYLRLLARLLWQPGLQRAVDLSDVVQQTMVKAHTNLCQFRGSTEAEWRGWLRAILRNELLQAARGHQGERSLNESSRQWDEILTADQSSPSERAIRDEQLERLADALAGLLDDERAAVELKHLHGCSVAFISRHLGRTKEATAGLLKRGMHKLRQHLTDAGETEKGRRP
jgi:RNA polymerase sigma-70 factor (ECF subfamily)